ncbi:ABC transporter substrate-binding protein [Nocardia sp. NPDC005366]|uniref:ABC transporter substrate-binding protein n=1 Tax=Nocardia sp. NPDC005366 TaxID=3156878 RepID=UPI0033BEE716
MRRGDVGRRGRGRQLRRTGRDYPAPNRKTVRAVVIAVLACVLAPHVTACTIPTRDERPNPAPVTVTHAFGATTVTGTPKNVVALGDQWVDAALALGVTPIARLATPPGDPPPWRTGTLDAARQLDATGDLAGQIAALHPDLILLDRLAADRATYDGLAALAPTIPRDPAVSWREEITMLGTVLRETERAADYLADYDTKLTEAVRANPGLAGKTYAATWLASDAQLFALTEPSAVTGEVFTRLGLRLPDTLTTRPAAQGHVLLSPDDLAQVGADLLLAGHSPGLDATYRGLPGYADLAATRRNAVVFLSAEEIAAMEQPTALSAVHLLDTLIPVLPSVAE